MIRVHIFDSHYSFGVGISILNEGEDRPREIARFENGQLRSFESFDPHAAVDPSLVLSDDIARALLDALTRRYHGAEDTRALRRDYDDERKRVDKLTAGLLSLAASLAAPAQELPGQNLTFHMADPAVGRCRGHLPGTLTAVCPDVPPGAM